MKTRMAGIAVIALAGCGTPPAQPAEAPAATQAPPTAPTPTEKPPATEQKAEVAPEPAPTAKAEEPPPGSPREKLMRAHFKETEQIRTAIITGKLTAAVGPAKTLASMEVKEAMPAKGRTFVTAMQAAAKRIGESPDAASLAAATADLGVACGGCHRLGAGPKPKVDAAPAAGDTMKSRMVRHAWATERLWEGLYAPSDAAWTAGAGALSSDPFPEEVLKKGGVHARSGAVRMKELVATAGAQKKPEDRAKLYASLLETCFGCHSATGGGK
jgi:hypothetical protein